MENRELNITIKQSRLGANIGAERVVGKNHADLDNLDFDSSGHTGFQKAGDYALTQDLENYVQKETGKSLSSNDFTDTYKTKLDSLENYDDTEVKEDISALETDVENIQGDIADVETALNGKVNTSLVGVSIAELDENGRVPTGQLPSYVDDVLEYASISEFPAAGETGKIYVAIDTNLSYRWGGSGYVEISPSLALGETSQTAYRGDRGKIAYDHATDSGKTSTSKAQGLYKVGVTSEGHISSATEVQKSDLTGLGVEDASNKVTTLDENSTNIQYPAAKCVYDLLEEINSKIAQMASEMEDNTLTGESIDISDSAYWKCGITPKGNTFQQTYQGKNLIDWSNPDSTTSNTTYTFVNDILTVSNSSGSSKRAQWDITTIWKQHAGEAVYAQNEGVEQSGSGTEQNVQIQIGYTDETPTKYYGIKSNYGVVIPADTSNVNYVYIRVWSNNTNTSQTGSISITKPMIFFGEEATDYEPFVRRTSKSKSKLSTDSTRCQRKQ